MRMFRHTGKYYLKKIEIGELTNQQVASILNTTVDIVNSAYSQYCTEKNPFQKKSFDHKNASIQILISVISTFIVLLTLFEMQAARNATYLPDISFGNKEVAISWDANGLPYISDETKDVISKVVNDDNTEINRIPRLKIYNLGVGVAKDISFVWDTKKYKAIYESVKL